MGEIRQVLKKKKKILFVFKGYTCRFKSEVFASFASIALRPCPVRNRNDYAVPRCRLYQSSSIPSVINLWNSLDNDTRNTRTFDTFKINLKRKVVLAKIPAHFLVGDRRPNVLYARLRRNCSSLKYDLFRSNIIINFLHHHNFRKDIGTLLFGDSQKDQAQNILLSNAVQTLYNFIRLTGGN